MVKTFIATSPVAIEDQIAEYAEWYELVELYRIETVRDGKHIVTVKFA